VKNRLALAALASLALFVLVVRLAFSIQPLRLAFVDVGQGDGLWLQTPDGLDVLVDGGRYGALLEYLQAHGSPDIELLVATHPDAGHIGGVVGVLETLPVAAAWVNGDTSTSQTDNGPRETGERGTYGHDLALQDNDQLLQRDQRKQRDSVMQSINWRRHQRLYRDNRCKTYLQRRNILQSHQFHTAVDTIGSKWAIPNRCWPAGLATWPGAGVKSDERRAKHRPG
jgi:beta-lactamase superfamily II metal-dependent hydrolase